MYEDRASKGAALLDRVRPNWAAAIRTDRLAMETCDRCILGQICGDYAMGWHAVLGPLPCDERFVASDHGFTLRNEEQDRDSEPDSAILARFAALADAWRAEIRKRLHERDL